jgi:hypothetical protein
VGERARPESRMSTTVEGPGMAGAIEVMAKPARRRFTVAEKLRVLQEAERCTKPDSLGILVQQESRDGTWSTHATIHPRRALHARIRAPGRSASTTPWPETVRSRSGSTTWPGVLSERR